MTKKKVKACVLDVPIPVKEGFLDLSDLVLSVWSDDQTRIERLALRGMGEAEARRRMSMQMTEDEYRQLANEVVRNDDGIDDLYESVRLIAERELRSRGIPLRDVSEEERAELVKR